MTKPAHKLSFFIGFLLTVYVLGGCADSDLKQEGEYFIRTGDRIVTVSDFNRAFEIAKAAYPHNEMQDPAAVRNVKLRVLNQMSEEMVLQERAKELGITISDEEVEKAVSDLKKDYPDDVFEQMLLEHAVSYQTWKKRIMIRLLMEKVIAKELEEQIVITPIDISNYFGKYAEDNKLTSDQKEASKELNVTIVRHLRREKIEEAYKSWIKELQKKYTIEVNKVQWEKIIGS
jgi:FKBP-type peptidyl-prolyl cis-trans isomerase (trigger factor)